MRPQSVTVDNVTSSSAVYPVSYRAPTTSLQVVPTSGDTYSVYYTVANILDLDDAVGSAPWVAITGMTSATAEAQKLVEGSITGLLFVLESGTGPSTLYVSQPDSF